MISVKAQRGFTILEVLVAFVVASLLLAVILSGFSSGLSGLLRSDRQAQAALIAQSRLAELSVAKQLEAMEYSELAEGVEEDFRWHVKVEPLQWDLADALAEKGAVLWRIDIEVFWSSGVLEHHYELTTLRMQRNTQ